MKKLLKLNIVISSIVLCLFSSIIFAQTQKGADIDGEADSDLSGANISMPNNNTIAIGAFGNNSDAGHVRVYTWDGITWVQKGSDIDGEASGDLSGRSLSMPDANTVAVGAPGNDGAGQNSGHVRVYSWNGSSWVQKGADIDGEASGDFSGISLSMPDANTVAVGAPSNDGAGQNSGHVRVYSWNGSSWVRKGSDLNGEAANDMSGRSVSMPDANTLAVGASSGGTSDAGQVMVYKWNGNSWIQKGQELNGDYPNSELGLAVMMPDSNTVAVEGNDSSFVIVKIYTFNGSAWIQKGVDIDSLDGLGANSNISMANSNIIAIGETSSQLIGPTVNRHLGHFRVYSWNGADWIQYGNVIYGEEDNDDFGYALDMPDEYTVAVGAYRNSGSGVESGHVRIYSLGATGLTEIESLNWGEVYPNPTGKDIEITLDEIFSEISVVIKNEIGQQINQYKFYNNNQITVSLTDKSGFYFIDVMTNTGKRKIFRVLKS